MSPVFILLAALLASPALAGLEEGMRALEDEDYETAAAEFERAAYQGNLESAYQLGLMYLHGGVGALERQAMEEVRANSNLQLGFALEGSGAYVADVRVAIHDPRQPDRRLLETVASGPWLYVKLPPGSYRVTAEMDRRPQSETVAVDAGGPREPLYFYWRE